MTRRLPSTYIQSVQRAALFWLIGLVAVTPATHAQQTWLAGKLGQDDAPTVVESERISGRPDRDLRLQREVEVTRGQTVINSDQAYYDIVDDRVEADGNVRVLRGGDRFSGNSLKLKLDTGIGYMDSIVYRLLMRNAQGHAERIDFESEDVATISNGVYTTCNGPDPDWYLKASKLTLDDGAGIGSARNAVLIFKGVPLAGTPRISFPLGESRKSGFLAPTFATSTSTGFQLTTPYYWDIAPNRDLTLFPRYMSTRGLMLGADARYLERQYAGETRFEFMNDSDYGSQLRYAISARHNHNVSPGLGLALDYNTVSDNNYARDFPLSHVFDRPGVNRRLLPQTATMSYSPGGPWSGTLQLSDFRVLQDPAAPIGVPYARLPQINLNYADFSDTGFSLSVGSQYTNFSHPTAVQGDRLVVNPRLSYNYLRTPGYFLIPSVSAHGTLYNLNQIASSAASTMTAPNRFVPSLSLDSGLIFERDSSFFGRTATQTLEPRAYYTYTPYVEQNGGLYPNFDTTIADISYGMMFRENRFIGNDRIGDANQLTLAMTSRYLETDGAERLRMAIGQRFNFDQQRVGLGNDLATNAGEKSDVLLLATGRVNRETRLDANFQYNQERGEINRVNVGVYWQPEPLKLLNLQYRKDSRNLANIPNTKYELIDISGQWPIADRWYGVGRVNYLIDEDRIGQSLYGVEHQADCWIFRLVSQRVPTAAGVVNNTTFVQLEFNGLSSLGTNPMRALRLNIPGYQTLGPATIPAQ
jgi:LPS-assembly protein